MGVLDIGQTKIAVGGIEDRLDTLIENDRVIFAEMQKQTAALEKIANAIDYLARAEAAKQPV